MCRLFECIVQCSARKWRRDHWRILMLILDDLRGAYNCPGTEEECRRAWASLIMLMSSHFDGFVYKARHGPYVARAAFRLGTPFRTSTPELGFPRLTTFEINGTPPARYLAHGGREETVADYNSGEPGSSVCRVKYIYVIRRWSSGRRQTIKAVGSGGHSMRYRRSVSDTLPTTLLWP